MQWDLTWTVSEDMVMYPGQPAPVFQDIAEAARDGYGMSEYRFWNHLGTHVDGPLHFFADGRALDEYPLARLVGPARVVRCDDAPVITASRLEAVLGPEFRHDTVILVTGNYRRWNTSAYYGFYPVLDGAAAQWLTERGVGMVAVDAPSVDPVETVDYPIHHILLGHDCLIVENLAYTPELPDAVMLAALPLRVRHSNGGPARVVAWTVG